MNLSLTAFVYRVTMRVMEIPEMTWEYCMEKAFSVMHSGLGAETAQARVNAWMAIARELRHSEEALQSQVQKIVAEAKPV